nr:MAG TPA: Porphobilinogen deaminase, C-terminal domain [Caudoviricetes sp.]
MLKLISQLERRVMGCHAPIFHYNIVNKKCQ